MKYVSNKHGPQSNTLKNRFIIQTIEKETSIDSPPSSIQSWFVKKTSRYSGSMDSDCKALFLTVTPIKLLVASDDDGVQALEQNCPGEQGATTCRVYYKPKRNSSGKKWRQQILRVECFAHGQATVRIGIAKDQVLCCRTRTRNVVGRKTCCYGKQQPGKINSTTNRGARNPTSACAGAAQQELRLRLDRRRSEEQPKPQAQKRTQTTNTNGTIGAGGALSPAHNPIRNKTAHAEGEERGGGWVGLLHLLRLRRRRRRGAESARRRGARARSDAAAVVSFANRSAGGGDGGGS
jgi:hypothetical protein